MTAIRILLICLTLVSVVGLSVGAANSSYSISPEQTIDVDSRTVEFESENYTVTEVGYANVNGDLSVTTSGPDDGTYDLYLRNSERDIVTTESRLSGTTTTTFDLNSLGVQAGTYILIIKDGERKVVTPVVASGYDITIDAPDAATVGEDVTASLAVSRKEGVDESIQSVKLHVRVDGESRQVTATETADGTYEATFEINQAGTFSVYAGIQGTDKVNGEYEVIAISDPHTIEASEQSATETPNGGGGQGDGTNSSDSEQSTSTSQATTTPTSTQPETSTETSTKTSVDTQTATTVKTDTPTAGSETETTAAVVTPADSETTVTTTTGDTGLAVSLSVLLALLAGWAGLNRE